MGAFLSENPLVLLIGAAEVAFWVFLVAGLAARYLLRKPRTSAGLLLCVPLVDLVLIVASLADVAGGSPPGPVHGLAAVYLGVTVAFGHSLIRWADVRFAHRFAGGPAPVRPPRGGAARTRREWREFGKLVLAAAIAGVVMLLVTVVAGSPIPAPSAWLDDPMWSWAARVGMVGAIWFAVGPLWATVFPGRDEEPARAG
ncbi:hypothetical protein EV383_5607 [Pseudonocardia sediminis]|uniref:Uncharacterized protein n=1 Tax=Pseudonocardia sediminis TaxID=1397368 RepID=A0A4Q7V786_PSEST|nr:hypothetical protein [Pseudonocardia sediminis]RZT88663.1 hypothetical protein EV383_5607 [Pseudonocardia sediminis]